MPRAALYIYSGCRGYRSDGEPKEMDVVQVSSLLPYPSYLVSSLLYHTPRI